MGNTIDGTSSSATSYKIEEPKTEGPPKEAPRSMTEKVAAWGEAASDCFPTLVPLGGPVGGGLATFVKEWAKTGSPIDAAKDAALKTAGDEASEAALHELGLPGMGLSLGLKYAACYDSVKSAATGEEAKPTAMKLVTDGATYAAPSSKKPVEAALSAAGEAAKSLGKSSFSDTSCAGESASSIIEQALAKLGKKS